MPILNNVEIFYARLDPQRPNAKFNKENPTWEMQIRTTSKATKKEWEALNLGVKMMENEETEEIFYRANLRKRSKTREGEPAKPVEVVDGKKNPIDPNTIGNGSIGNVRIYQYPYGDDSGKTATVLMKVQLTKHIVYTPADYDDDFEETETETIREEDEEDEGQTYSKSAPASEDPVAPKRSGMPSTPGGTPAEPEDDDDEY